jgi:uncharacterized membrane protein
MSHVALSRRKQTNTGKLCPCTQTALCSPWAANQGVYNLFMCSGMLLSVLLSIVLEISVLHRIRKRRNGVATAKTHALLALPLLSDQATYQAQRFHLVVFKSFFLMCIIVAGIVGGATTDLKLLFAIQPVPALIALILVLLGQ